MMMYMHNIIVCRSTNTGDVPFNEGCDYDRDNTVININTLERDIYDDDDNKPFASLCLLESI